nr:uncharacterized protein LOC111508790 [Leptinotarsa decemlineata]
MTTYCTELTTTTIKSRINAYKKTSTFLIVQAISHIIPDQPIQRELIKLPANVKLVDPDFHRPAPVDILLGAGTTLSLISVGQIKLTTSGQQELHLQKTTLGWIIGEAAPSSIPATAKCHITTTVAQFELKKFCEIEECPQKKRFTQEKERCEQYFRNHISRDVNGRYVVALLSNPHTPKLGRSYHTTLKRFESTERKLRQNLEFKKSYDGVLEDYMKQEYMSLVTKRQHLSKAYYLPHHAVVKEMQLHRFADVIKKAYGACSYLSTVDE